MNNGSSLACTDLESGVRAIPNSVTDNINNSTDGGTNSAILRYFGAFFGDPTTQDTSGSQPLVETNLHVRPFMVNRNACVECLFSLQPLVPSAVVRSLAYSRKRQV